MAKYISIAMMFLVLMVFSGCSDDSIAPITPDNSSADFEMPVSAVDADDTNRELWGVWTADFSNTTSGATINAYPNRSANAHYNITSMIPAPGIVLNSYDPLFQVANVEFTISNPYALSGYDVRLIIFTDSVGHFLLNADDWTTLYDIPGELPINPFKAFAKTEPNRIFAGMANHTENLLIALPGGNPNVTFAVDASFPSNCEEPYEISGFTQDTLKDFVGASAHVEITVLDWQNDTSAVQLYCPLIAGGSLVDFTQLNPTTWEANLVNQTGASEGNYGGYIMAYSADSGSLALYDDVIITVTSGSCTNQELFYDFDDCPGPDDGTYICQGWNSDDPMNTGTGGCNLPNTDEGMWPNGNFLWGCAAAIPFSCGEITPGFLSTGSDMDLCDTMADTRENADYNVVSPGIILPVSENGVIEFEYCSNMAIDGELRLYISLDLCEGPWIEIMEPITASECSSATVDISAYTGDSVMFRFQYTAATASNVSGTDLCGENAGILIDNISINGCFEDVLEEK